LPPDFGILRNPKLCPDSDGFLLTVTSRAVRPEAVLKWFSRDTPRDTGF
jgi:hypothetical protein